MLQFMGSQRVGHDLMTEQQDLEENIMCLMAYMRHSEYITGIPFRYHFTRGYGGKDLLMLWRQLFWFEFCI